MLNVALIFGGRPAEHDVSVRSARSVYKALDRKRYLPIPIGVARDGKWWLQENADDLPSEVDTSGGQIVFLPGGRGQAIVRRYKDDDGICQVNVVFPALWDGLLQGILETAQVPFIGSRLPVPAICLNKQMTKRILRDAGLPVARSLLLTSREEMTFHLAQEALCSSSLFVKPTSLHSSIGVSKVTCESEFQAAVDLAFSYGSKVLVEENVEGRELECAILQDAERPGKLLCSWPGEIILADRHAFFTYEAKIGGNGVTVKTKAELDPAVADRARGLACEAFRVIGCEGLARVDFLMRSDGELLINEVCAVPNLTPASMFSRMMEGSGIPYNVLVQRLFEDAIRRSRLRHDGGDPTFR
ncbi:D-alanine--D-alanine ligase [Bradyrhizobium sp. 166]|uniref:D-alanine--D-alanine ligase family protein n=1 Tax=Bradyrhizobium sp. 166 TaxID=2782638 RepID=UPI001FF9BD40|nr:D-alanine--D-alanine ligase family protein [Bradyrhizobium sp. 166]MCK1604775.1 D-alanine--D-alanine ligase [Bradyrhizobium sp. 166]